MMDIVQLEAGRYNLKLQIEYRNPSSRLWHRSKQTESIVKFVVDPEVRDLLRSSLRNTLGISASNFILGQTQNVMYPEYQPRDITEI